VKSLPKLIKPMQRVLLGFVREAENERNQNAEGGEGND
jgi:hypothetical protein